MHISAEAVTIGWMIPSETNSLPAASKILSAKILVLFSQCGLSYGRTR